MPGLLDAVKAWLRSQYYIHVPDDWLEACAEWIQSEQGNLSPGQLRQAIYEQWLLSDLRELAHPCLPNSITAAQKYMLEGRFSLQMDNCRDASQASYGQLKKLQGRENENVNVNAHTQYTPHQWEAKSSRMLMLALTDGVQDIQAMEYQPIRQLYETLTPGTKITIIGPVQCRLGVLMLMEKNVRVLGGEVEALAEQNSLKSVLARTLNLEPENLPVNLRPKTSVSTMSPTSQFESSTVASRRIPASHDQTKRPSNQNRANRDQSTNQRPRMDHSIAKLRDDGFHEDDDVFEQIDADMLTDHWGEDDDMDAVMSQINIPTSSSKPVTSAVTVKRPRTNADVRSSDVDSRGRVMDQPGRSLSTRTHYRTSASGSTTNPLNSTLNRGKDSSRSDMDCHFLDDDDDGDFKICEAADVASRTDIGGPVVTSAGNPSQDFGYLDVDFLGDEDDFSIPKSPKRCRVADASRTLVEKIDDLYARKSTLRRTDEPLDIDCEPFIYLRQVVAMFPVGVLTILRVKAYVSTVVQKLDHNKGRYWSLGVKINDGTASLDVHMSDSVITKMMTLTAGEAHGMRKQGVKDNEVRNKLQQAIGEFQRKLIDLSTVFVLSLEPNSYKITVAELIEFTVYHAEKLYERLISNHIT